MSGHVKKKVLALHPLPEGGWRIGVVLRRPIESINVDDYKIGTLPVVGMALLDDGTISPVVAMQDGRVLPVSDLEYELLCMSAPGEDIERVAQLAIAARHGDEALRHEQLVA